MVQCELCGTDTAQPTTVKVEGAELDVCSTCADFGTEVETQQASSTSTKYSTGASSSGASSGGGGGSRSSASSSPSGTRRRNDMFDDIEELAEDYDDRIRQAREGEGLSQQELADQLNEKASLIRKLERGETLPSDAVQSKLERALDISLTEGVGDDDVEWEGGGSASDGFTLGDVVRRKDS